MGRDDLIRRLKTLQPRLTAEGVSHLAVFGSRVRGDNSSGSDIDILLDTRPEARFSLMDLIGIEHLVADETGLSAHAAMRRSLDADFHAAIEKDVVEVF